MKNAQFFPHLMAALRIAIKAKIHITMSYFVVAMVIIVLLVVEFSARQLATVSLDVGISLIKLSLPLIAVFLAQELFSRELDKKLHLTSLTFPSSRATWFFSRLMAILLICLVLLVMMAAILAVLTMYIGNSYQQATPVGLGLPYLATISFAAVDLLVVVVVASFIAISTQTPSFVLIGTLGFTLIARSYASIISLLESNPYAIAEYADPKMYQDSLSLIAFIIPDLGRLDIRMTALYNAMNFMPADWPMLLLATLVYTLAIAALSVWILNRREFH